MRFLRSSLVAAALFFAVLPAKAGLLLEPYLGYEIGSLKVKGGSAFESDLRAPVIGARIGFTLPIFFGALDYSIATGKADRDSGATVDSDAKRNSLFAVVGASLPFFRVYGGYGFMNDLELKNGGGKSTYKGTALKLGGSFTALPLVSLNLEYIMSDFDKIKTDSGEASIGSGNFLTEAKSNTVMLSVSLPLDL